MVSTESGCLRKIIAPPGQRRNGLNVPIPRPGGTLSGYNRRGAALIHSSVATCDRVGYTTALEVVGLGCMLAIMRLVGRHPQRHASPKFSIVSVDSSNTSSVIVVVERVALDGRVEPALFLGVFGPAK